MLDQLNKLYEYGLLHKQVHPKFPLTIWNYSEKVQYENLWSDLLLQCRGLVTDECGNIVARPFKKFFNYSENKHIPTENFDVLRKEDGSLGILFYYNGEWILSTRGSFTSDQSVKGFNLLKKYDYSRLQKKFTYLFELIIKDNRIVVDYGNYEDVILLGMIETETGYEVDLYGDVDLVYVNMIRNTKIPIVKKYDGITDYTVLKDMIGKNEEGFVVKFSNGDRIKIKGDEYLRLHKIMTNISTTSVWEVLQSENSIDSILHDVPDEFFEKIKNYELELKKQHSEISEYCNEKYNQFKYGDNNFEPSKKEFAEYVQKNIKKELRSVMFGIWDNKDYSKMIWKIIKPDFKKL